MNYSHYEVFCPMRAKRRQSDAKWRASVATCYDALKYVVPNVKQLSKRKISKALILQESEKHIKDLEEAIGYILNVECPNKGKEVLWKNEAHWSHCSLDTLRADFSEQQRRVFHTSAHGRRCYNLLHDIKEEVFNMKADPKQMVFVKERLEKNCTGNATVNFSQIGMMDAAYTTEGAGKGEGQDIQLTDLDQRKKGQLKNVTHVSQINFAGRNFGQLVRQQPRPRQRLCRTEDDSSLLKGYTENKGIPFSTVFHEISTTQQATTKGSKDDDEQPQLVPNMASTLNSAFVTTKQSLENDIYTGTGCTSIKSSYENSTALNSSIGIIQDKHEGRRSIKVESIGREFYILSQGEDYTCLLKALKCEKEQEVPSLAAPTTAIEVQQSRPQSSYEAAEICKRKMNFGNTLKLCPSQKDGLRNNSDKTPAKNKVISPSCSDFKKIESKHLAEPMFTVFSSPLNLLCLDAKKEVDVSQVSSKGDPFLSSLCTPKSNASTLYGQSDSDLQIKRPTKPMSARKKLNFNCPPYSATNIFVPRLLSPERSVRSSPSKSGFTPIKLPDDLGQNSEEISALDSLVSPWKVLSSPFDSKTGSRGYHSSDYLEDNLLCLETIDALELDDGLSNEITPSHHARKDISEPGGSCKRKSSFVSPTCGSKGQPKCRRRLERFYDQPSSSKNNSTESDDGHVVPELDARHMSDLTDMNNELYSNTSTPLKENYLEVAESSDFDGFFFYYRQVSHKLKDKIGVEEMQSSTMAAKVAQMWVRLPQQDRMTMSTLANLEAHSHKESESFGSLSQDLEDIKVEPLDTSFI